MTSRIYIASDRVTVSKPGFSAKAPPDVSYQYLALDSRLQSGRPLEIGVVPNYVFPNVVPFTTTYQAPPAIDITFFSIIPGVGTQYGKSIGMRDANSGTAYNRTSYYYAIWNNQFQIVDDMQFVRAIALTHPINLFYVLWPTW